MALPLLYPVRQYALECTILFSSSLMAEIVTAIDTYAATSRLEYNMIKPKQKAQRLCKG